MQSMCDVKIVDENGKTISRVSNGYEIIVETSSSSIKAKIDWLSGKIDGLKGEDVYLICILNFRSVFQWILPFEFRKYFSLLSVSQEEYDKAIQTKGKSLGVKGKVTKLKSIVSRLISFIMLLLASLLFYYTDYSKTSLSTDFEFIRIVGLFLFIGAIVGLIWNKEKYTNVYYRAVLLVLLSLYFFWRIPSAEVNKLLLIFPIVAVIAVVLFYKLMEKTKKN